MQYNLPTVLSIDKPVAVKHQLGGEKKLWATRALAVHLGEVYLAGDGSGVYTVDPLYTPDATGNDLVVKVDGELRAPLGSPAVLTVVGTDQNSALLSGTATFAPPGWVKNTSNDFEEGVALDIAPNGNGLRFKTITSVSVTNAKRGSRLQIFKMPDAADWQYIEKVESVEADLGISPGVPIPDGLDGASEVTRGRSDVPSLSISALHRSQLDGLMRFAGAQCCIRVDIVKQGKLPTERMIYANAIIKANGNMPDGSELSKDAVSGMYEDAFCFFAP